MYDGVWLRSEILKKKKRKANIKTIRYLHEIEVSMLNQAVYFFMAFYGVRE